MLRRRVHGTATGILAVVLVIVAGYWAFLASHQYLEVRGDNLILVHGRAEAEASRVRNIWRQSPRDR